MTWRSIVALAIGIAIALALAGPSRAQPAPGEGSGSGSDAGSGSAQPQFEPPHAKAPTDVPYPANAPAHDQPIVVTVKLRVDPTGAVAKVDLVTAPQPVFDDAVIAAATAFTFEPATYGGKPVAVEITFTHTFLPPPPPPPPADTGPARTSVLRGKLVELGTRAPVESATITAIVDGQPYVAEGDPKGAFRLELPAGAAKITITAPAHNVFVQAETLAPKQELAVTYYVERDRYDPYEIVVVGEQRREEVSRITLRGPELKQVPGTFGDPFRVVQALPGVASVVSLLPFPIVRGASPSSTGFLLDGIRLPMLYHLLSGPSVVHPDFVDEIQFYPGGAPVPYGGYTGGIIDGRTARARRDEHLVDLDVNLLQAGGLIREPIPEIGATATVAARYGYPGYLLSLATDRVSLSYWDYQFRLDGGKPRTGWTLFAYGAHDELDTPAANAQPGQANPPLSPSLILNFHRVDLRGHLATGDLSGTARVVLGYDKSLANGTDFSVLSLDPQLGARYAVDKQLTLAAGLEGDLRKIDQGTDSVAAANAISMITAQLHEFSSLSGFAEALWRPTPDWLIRPGVRADVYDDGTTTKGSVDPRLTARYALSRRELADVPPDSDDSAVWLKGSLGIYHQPPRFVLPVPGLDLMPLKYGLLRSFQSSLGVEVPLEHRFQLSTEAYFNYMDPTIFDLSVNESSVVSAANPTLIPTSVVTPMDGQQFIDRLTTPQKGRSYGLEVLLRRVAKSGVFGWVSYTLSRSERYRDGDWVPYDFDRTHLVNVVAGLPLKRNWDIGVRLQYQSGKPVTTTAGYNTARTDGYVRVDVRIDKRAVWKKWLLDFYVDITNIALLPEEVTTGTTIRYVLPTVGLRGRF